jgi:hypothetical protein|tara:strand:- start:713 stop:1684 length:972 start_codon:yes stop_codon:yes gene_type:complete
LTSDGSSLSTPLAPPSEAKVVASFDWFTLVGAGKVGDAMDVLSRWCGDLSEASGAQGYRRRWFTEDKAVLFEENIRNAECWQVSLPGAVCAKLNDSIKGPVCDLLGMGARVARIDPCVDLYSVHLVPQFKRKIAELNENGWLKKKGQTVRGRGADGGWTEYIGSRNSPRYIRVYDKGAKENTEPDYWLRFETVLKKGWATPTGEMLKPKDDWSQLAQRLAATAAQELRDLAPEIWDIVYDGTLQPLTMDVRRKSLDGFIANAKRQVVQTIAMIGQQEGMTIFEVMTAMGLDQVKPSEVQSKHSPLLTDFRSLLDDGGTLPNSM